MKFITPLILLATAIKHPEQPIIKPDQFRISIVPKSDWISDFDTKVALAQSWSHLKDHKQEALDLYLQLLTEKPNDPKLVIELANLYLSLKEYQQALDLLYPLIALNPNKTELLTTASYAESGLSHAAKARELFLRALAIDNSEKMHLDYANLIMLWGDFIQSEEIYRQAVSQKPDSFDLQMKLAGVLLASQQYEETEKIYLLLLNKEPSNKKVIQALAELKINQKDDEAAIAYLDQLERSQEIEKLYSRANHEDQPEETIQYDTLDPEDFTTQLRIAEKLSANFHYDDALYIYNNLLEIFPNNYKLLLSIARVHSWAKEYQTGIDWYDYLICLNPHNPLPIREKARTAMWGRLYPLSMATYGQLIGSEPQEDTLENHDNFLVQQTAFLESESKSLVWNKRPLHAIPAFQDVIVTSPGNEEALFDSAQNYNAVGLPDYANAVYDKILTINKDHNLVQMAQQRNLLRLNWGVSGNFLYWREVGSGQFSNSQIARYRTDIVAEEPLSFRSRIRYTQHAWVENPFYNYRFYPAEGQSLETDWFINEYVHAACGFTYKNYFNKFYPTWQAKNRIDINCNDYCTLSIGLDRQDEIYNLFDLRQMIQSKVTWISGVSNLTHYWNVEGRYRHLDYNDHNTLDHVTLQTQYALTDDPNVFKLILMGNYYNTAQESISIYEGPIVVDTIHPYWTPQNYYSGYVTLEYRYDYRFLEFFEAPQRYFDIKVTGGTDTDDNPSFAGIVEWVHDFEDHWGINLKGYIQRSPMWNAEGAWATVSYRF